MSEEIVRGKSGNKAPTHELSRLRGQQAAMYKLKGYTYENILKKINDDDKTRHWGVISMSQLKRDVGKYMNFSIGYSNRELKEVLAGEKELYLAEVERNYSTVYSLLMSAIYYYQHEKEMIAKKENKPVITRGQIPWIIDSINKIGEHLSKIKGWDSSGNNINILNIQNNELEIHTRAGEDLGTIEPEVANDFKAFLDSIVWKDEEPAGLATPEGVDREPNANGKQEVEVSKS